MGLTEAKQQAVLKAARALIGTKYDVMDCSKFVQQAYAIGGLHYPYRNTAGFRDLVPEYFVKISAAGGFDGVVDPADVLMFKGHVGLWDPRGCQVLQDAGAENSDCRRFKNQVPFLSSRTGGNRGPDYGMMKWWGDLRAIYRCCLRSAWVEVSLDLLSPSRLMDVMASLVTRTSRLPRFNDFYYFHANGQTPGGVRQSWHRLIIG